VGVARKDGENGAKAVLEYLQSAPTLINPNSILDEFKAKLDRLNKPIIHKSDVQKLVEAENSEAQKSGLPAYKYGTNDEMLAVMGFKKPIAG
jgi:hypothetical protein